MDINEIVGIIGLIILLTAFCLNNFMKKKLRRRTQLYNGMNFVSSALLAFYAYAISSIVFVALEIIWAGLALYFLAHIIREGHLRLAEKRKRARKAKKRP